ncbi:EAL domain-containing protein [Vogesella sp. LIG4]|uniref:EAL domain-containing protein n=1 Tax=Vogesella sp. LIG4 TaxID=1192162 RepID=UPI00081F9355|nr:EAL domain-containing protein [Vogesella sp. LIG4]SCK15922.1 PAS domain S-box-containing protein/diguanylate cyclase (GGDEF) domain-containing protein [Vogesella sp. LIG4]
MSHRIQIVEDERIVALDLKECIRSLGFEVVDISASGERAIARARELRPDLTLMDIHLDGEMSGTEAAAVLRQELDIPVVFLTAYAEENTLKAAEESAPYGYLLKPFELRELNATLRMAFSCRAAEAETRDQHRRLQMAIDTAKLGIWEWDDQQSTFFSQGHLQQLTGIHPGTLRDNAPSFMRLLAKNDRDKLLTMLQQRGQVEMVASMQRPDGEAAWVELNAKQFQGQNQGQTKLVGVLRDVTERVQMEEKLRQASAVFHTTAEGIAIVSPQRTIQIVNPAFLRMTGYGFAEVMGQDIDELLHERRHSGEFYLQLAEQINGLWNGEILCRRNGGELFPVWEHICAVHDEYQQLSHFIIACSDISGIHNAQRELNHMAFHDALTGLGNRHLLQEQLEVELDRALCHQQPLGLVFIDLDGFKLVNDSLGHAAGDRLLQIVAARIKETIRRGDLATRFGGDEFFIVCPGSGENECIQLANRLINRLEEPILLTDEPVVISCSIGIALFPHNGQEIDKLLRAADSAMYEAKIQGKRRWCLFNDGMADKVRLRMQTEQHLRQAVRRQSFELHYQPLVTLGDDALAGFEALVRWRDGEQLIMPDQFIPVAEECGLIHDIGEWVLRSACTQACEWQERYQLPLRVAVNVSARQFAAPDFVRRVGLILLETGLYPHLLELEVTESTLQIMEDSQRVLGELKALGVSIAIDDFGTGYSSMALLKHLTIDRLKIDRSFVKDTPEAVRDCAICRAIVTLAHSLMLSITAEGVETAEQANFLSKIGCDTAQGYLFARPLAPDALVAYLADWEQRNGGGDTPGEQAKKIP